MTAPVPNLFPEVPASKRKAKAPIVLPPVRRVRDPFHVEGDACVSFSGGRTSGYMLWRMLQSAGGAFPPNVHVIFANTGKEREETLEFVRDVQLHWNAPIRWVEWVAPDRDSETTQTANGWFREVTFETASRNGEPFEALIDWKQAIPNRKMRFCTEFLKVWTMRSFMQAQDYQHWTCCVGLRADEPGRVAKFRSREQPEFEDTLLPLYDAGVGVRQVLEFWKQQPFDLQLTPDDSNCDACFLKGARLRYHVFRREPWRADWWLRQEGRTGNYWINPEGGRPSYTQLQQLAVLQEAVEFPPDDLDDLRLDCMCGEAA